MEIEGTIVDDYDIKIVSQEKAGTKNIWNQAKNHMDSELGKTI